MAATSEEPERQPPRNIPGQTTISDREPPKDFVPSPNVTCAYCPEMAMSREPIRRATGKGKATATLSYVYSCQNPDHQRKVKRLAWAAIPLGGAYAKTRREHGLEWDSSAPGR